MTTIANTFASKLAVAFVAIAMMFSLVSPAQAQTAEELQAQIDQLMATINALQAQLGQSTGSTMSSDAYVFTRSLTVGATGADVTALQNYLISEGFSIPAGATGYFGSQTKAAVAAWQAANGVSPAVGYFGPVSQAKYAELMAAKASSDTTTDDSADTTDTTDTTDNTDNGTTLGNGEGSIDVVTQISADDTEVKEGEESGIFAFEAEVTGDVEVNRLDLYMDVSGAASTRADKYFQGASLWVDGDKVADLDVADWDEDYYGMVTNGTGKEYRLRFSGLNLVFADGDVPQFQLALDANNVIDSTDISNATWAVDMETDAIRIVDGQGFTDNAGLSVETTFNVANQLVAKLTVAEATDSPDATTLEVSDTDTTRDVEVAKFEIREKNGVDTTIEDMTFTVTATNTVTNESVVVRTASIWDGSTELASKSVVDGGVVLFENMGLDIPADGRVTVTIKLDFADSTPYPDGETVTVQWDSIDDATDENGNSEGDMTITAGPVTSATHTLREVGLAIVAGTMSGTQVIDGNTSSKNYGDYKVKFDVTAFGDDLYIPLTSAKGASSTVGVAYQIEDSNGAVIATGTTTESLQRVSGGNVTGQYVQVTDGSSATFEATITFDPAASGQYRVQILTVGYALTAAVPTATEVATPVEDFETENVFVSN